MAFVATGAPGQYHVLIEFNLDSTTLRYADEDISIMSSGTVGHYYQGRLTSAGTIRRQLNSVLEPRERIETYDVGLDNRDLAIAHLIRSCTFANRDVNVWLGEGVTKASYTNIFPAAVVHPNGIRWNTDEATITIADRRLKDRRTLPLSVYTTASFAYLEPRAIGAAQPSWYGDWRSTVAGGQVVPALCVNTNTKTFRVACHRIGEIERVLKNAQVLNLVTQVCGISLQQAQFSLNGVSYDATSDIISVNGRGFLTDNGSTIELPGETLKHMQTHWCGVSSATQNGTAYQDVNLGTDYTVRRFINQQDSTEVYIGELLNETQVDMRFVAGQYSPKVRTLDLESTRPDFYEDDVLHDETEFPDFNVEYDPDRYYCNQIRAKYGWDPVDQGWAGAFTAKATAEQASVNSLVERQWDFNWLYDAGQVEARCIRELWSYAHDALSVRVGLGMRALAKNVADQINLTFSILADQPLTLRELETNLVDMTVKARGDDVYAMIGMGRWAPDTLPDYPSASDFEKGYYGWWTTLTGYIISGSAATLNGSRYY